jgi:pimeloyl-ACP methyl ester carboxylesterase
MRVNRADLFVETRGPADAPPVVLLHGFPFGTGLWEAQAEALAESWRVIAYDARGHGRSGTGDGPWAFEDLVDDLLGVLDGHGVDRAVIAGISMGGYAALRFAEREPARVRALVLADTRSEADGDAAKLKRAGGLRLLRAGGAKAYAESFLKSVLHYETLRSRPEIVAKARAMIEACSPAGIGGNLLAMAGRTDTTGALGGFAFPVLVVAGEKDGLIPPKDAKAMADRIPGARFAVVPHAAHLPCLENPEEFNAVLLEFLEGLPAE